MLHTVIPVAALSEGRLFHLVTCRDGRAQVSFLPLDISDEDSIQDVLAQIDAAIQFGEDADVKTNDQEFDIPDDDM